MSVDELAILVQQGREDLLPVLWDQVKGLIAYFANQFNRQWDCSKYGIEVDDLIQEGYFAMLRTLEKHDPEKGSFNSLFAYDLRKAFQDAIGRTDRKRGDLLNHCLSLDAELDSSDSNSDSLYELVPDGYDYTGPVEHQIYLQELHNELEKALAELPEVEAAAIRAEYWEGLTREEIAEKQSLPVQEVKNNKQKALKKLRKRTKELEQYLDSYTPFYRHTGIGWYRQNNISSVEYNVFLRDRMERKYDSLHQEQ